MQCLDCILTFEWGLWFTYSFFFVIRLTDIILGPCLRMLALMYISNALLNSIVSFV